MRRNQPQNVTNASKEAISAPISSPPTSMGMGLQLDFAHIPLTAPSSQRKPPISSPVDPLEREADDVADKVIKMAEPAPVGLVAAGIQAIQTKPAPPANGGPALDAMAAVRAAERGGAPLSREVRSYFEPRFGQDFSRVRVHADREAGVGARAIQARAYTFGRDIVFEPNEYAPETTDGKRLLAHELTHAVQQSVGVNALQRTPAAPQAGGKAVPFDRSKVDVSVVADMVAIPIVGNLIIMPQVVTVTFNDPAITHLAWELYDPTDNMLPRSFGTIAGSPNAASAPFMIENLSSPWPVAQGRHIVRCVGYDNANNPVAYADRTFFIWTSKPTGKPPDITALEAEKAQHEATTKAGSGKSFGEVGSGFAKLKDVTHDLAVLQTGTGTYVGTQCSVKPSGTTATNCTDIVLEVLENTFTQQGRAADWDKVKKKYAKNTAARGDTKLSGLDVQAALQSEAGWKGIYWAPDPKYQVPKAELDKANSDEASYTSGIAKNKGTYYKDFGKKGYPGLSIAQTVTNYAPEAPNTGYGTASTTAKDTTRLDKLKKVPFGVLAAHGGQHMTIITYGKVLEVHWSHEATSLDLIEQTDLERWAVGPRSGYHYYASGAIVAPAADIDAAFA
jgi:hypothetical protein